MKKILPGIFAIALAFAASAFTTPSTRTADDPLYHWFAPNGTYLGQRTQAAQAAICDGDNQVCASGYEQITVNGENQTIPVEESYFDDVLKP
ncbi:hypothetical protein [Flavisolibacter ginsenosidimutans]|uniref:Secreted protein n=1 Tax=Flavisolibacter ginsenosidimutans TaxID=661481 RepID=A0A5B8UKI3_9BACT|nr:hypothetical protein [Flavisolibacter ginsenosidimutans]QEC56689.1 hypothetical protein FSB75_12540 [Flavisolibacter ginsenosidimutans]